MYRFVAYCVLISVLPICSISARLKLSPQGIVGSSDLIVVGVVAELTLPDDPNKKDRDPGSALIHVERILLGTAENDIRISNLSWIHSDHPKQLRNGQRALYCLQKVQKDYILTNGALGIFQEQDDKTLQPFIDLFPVTIFALSKIANVIVGFPAPDELQ